MIKRILHICDNIELIDVEDGIFTLLITTVISFGLGSLLHLSGFTFLCIPFYVVLAGSVLALFVLGAIGIRHMVKTIWKRIKEIDNNFK